MKRKYLYDRFHMILSSDEMGRVSIKENAGMDPLVIVDVHGLACREAKRLVNNIINVARIAFKLVVIHGFNHGTAIKEMLQKNFLNSHIKEEHEVPGNPGCTCMSIAA